jgi:hypothetical protein
MQVSATPTPSDAATVAGAFIWAYQQVTGHAPPSEYSWLMPMSQSALETGSWGRSLIQNNLGFVTTASPGDDYFVKGSNPLHFAAYGTLGQGALAMMRVLARDGALVHADAGDLSSYVASLQAGCYVGCDPGVYPSYEADIASLMQQLVSTQPRAYSENIMSSFSTGEAVGLGIGIVGAALLAYMIIEKDKPSVARGYARGARSRARAMDNPVQSLLFSRHDGWTPSRARNWAKSHGYKYGDVDVTDNQIHLRQTGTGRYKRYATKSFGSGIQARLGFR